MTFARAFCSLLLVVALGLTAGLAHADDDPVASVQNEGVTEVQRYTQESYDALPDEDKQNVYYNFPELLPENFDPMIYWNLFHSEDTP